MKDQKSREATALVMDAVLGGMVSKILAYSSGRSMNDGPVTDANAAATILLWLMASDTAAGARAESRGETLGSIVSALERTEEAIRNIEGQLLKLTEPAPERVRTDFELPLRTRASASGAEMHRRVNSRDVQRLYDLAKDAAEVSEAKFIGPEMDELIAYIRELEGK